MENMGTCALKLVDYERSTWYKNNSKIFLRANQQIDLEVYKNKTKYKPHTLPLSSNIIRID